MVGVIATKNTRAAIVTSGAASRAQPGRRRDKIERPNKVSRIRVISSVVSVTLLCYLTAELHPPTTFNFGCKSSDTEPSPARCRWARQLIVLSEARGEWFNLTQVQNRSINSPTVKVEPSTCHRLMLSAAQIFAQLLTTTGVGDYESQITKAKCANGRRDVRTSRGRIQTGAGMLDAGRESARGRETGVSAEIGERRGAHTQTKAFTLL
ncbi:hypothetical protein EVAR_90188_1 [Eumeta japonica]|uniref:Uncharacterized protein n=1 Tax=Eumeta variegata TaxID=151549 RepID=A0A4C1WUF1_EUMVA|nr:hypothetical protein EVAR_90188_1 [Eumeta japonica]